MTLSTSSAPPRSVPDPRTPAPARPPFEPSAGGAELHGRSPRGVNTVQGWVAVLLGLPFVAGGVATGLLLAGRMEIEEGGRMVFPPVAMLAMGLCFVLTGLSFVVHGVRGVLRCRGAAALRARYPGQPWMADYAWHRRGGRDESPGEAWRALWFAGFMGLFLVPFHWVAFFSAERPVIFQVATLLFDLVGLALVGRALRVWARRLRYGASRLAFARFPFAAGGEAELLLDDVSPLARSRPLRATLRCVEERNETRGGRNHSRTTVCYELYRAEALVPAGERSVCFAIPAAAPTTALAALPTRYWELELRADAPGVDYGARFLVPVY